MTIEMFEAEVKRNNSDQIVLDFFMKIVEFVKSTNQGQVPAEIEFLVPVQEGTFDRLSYSMYFESNVKAFLENKGTLNFYSINSGRHQLIGANFKPK